MKTIYVRIADLAVLQREGLLITIGLGSCVGVALYDLEHKIAGLAHIFLYDSNKYSRTSTANRFNPAKFADTAIPELIKTMKRLGSRGNHLVAHLAGGSKLFDFKFKGADIGQKNLEASQAKLRELGITVLSEDTGGNYGRTMKIDASTGKVMIISLNKGEKKRCYQSYLPSI